MLTSSPAPRILGTPDLGLALAVSADQIVTSLDENQLSISGSSVAKYVGVLDMRVLAGLEIQTGPGIDGLQRVWG